MSKKQTKQKSGKGKKPQRQERSKSSRKAPVATKVKGEKRSGAHAAVSDSAVSGSPPSPAASPPSAELPEIAFYYPNPYWQNSDWAKNLILFFDGIGMLIPNYMPHAGDPDDEPVVEGLRQHNLFHVFEPESFVDKEAAERLTQAVTAVIASGALDRLSVDDDGPLATLSMSRMGFHVAEDSAKAVRGTEKAKARERFRRRRFGANA